MAFIDDSSEQRAEYGHASGECGRCHARNGRAVVLAYEQHQHNGGDTGRQACECH